MLNGQLNAFSDARFKITPQVNRLCSQLITNSAANKRERLLRVEDKIEKIQRLTYRKKEMLKILTAEVERSFVNLKKSRQISYVVKGFPRDAYVHLLYESGDSFQTGTHTHVNSSGKKDWCPVFRHYFGSPGINRVNVNHLTYQTMFPSSIEGSLIRRNPSQICEGTETVLVLLLTSLLLSQNPKKKRISRRRKNPKKIQKRSYSERSIALSRSFGC
eukprot:TRINITY_DN1792_c0_g2_i2.p1 TRINITY_DN1792_c0_g2~~TRINITY_DN1792_c0_g2_i2.p1  ORF type:complete len:217 (-),score=9.72 TRINITY_DN1792_c0_g2_i2:262-912(-)